MPSSISDHRFKSQKVEAGPVTLKNVLDYIQASYWINTKLGYDQRDVRAHLGGDYKDYWHYILDHLEFQGNDSYCQYNTDFKYLYDMTLKALGPDDWRTHIAKVWAEEYPESYKLWMSW